MSVLVGGNCHILVSIMILTRVYKHSNMGQPSLKSYKSTIFMKQPSLEVTTMAYTRASNKWLQL